MEKKEASLARRSSLRRGGSSYALDEAQSAHNHQEGQMSPTRALKTGAASAQQLMQNPQGPPLDYSFLEIKVIEELREVMPRSGYRKCPPDTIEDPTGLTVPNPLKEEWVKPPRDDLQTQALKLGNNQLTALPPVFHMILREVMDRPRHLSWIDLSFNMLEDVPQVLGSYQGLSVVYLHANRIRKTTDAQVLAELPQLRSLALHGNPCEQTKNYRLIVSGMLGGLRSLDFCAITLIDREKANAFYAGFTKARSSRDSHD